MILGSAAAADIIAAVTIVVLSSVLLVALKARDTELSIIGGLSGTIALATSVSLLATGMVLVVDARDVLSMTDVDVVSVVSVLVAAHIAGDTIGIDTAVTTAQIVAGFRARMSATIDVDLSIIALRFGRFGE